jgi:hypothetical protein
MTSVNLIGLLKAGAVLLAAMLLGNWFMAELKAAKAKGKPWHSAYFSLPGILIILAVLLPVFWWLATR